MNIAPWLLAVSFAAGSSAAQPSTAPATVTLAIVDATFAETLATISKVTGIEIRLDESVPEAKKNAKVPHVNFVNASVDDALRFLAKHSQLEAEILDQKTVLIRPSR